jgi:DNA sulfur modification protein DndB
MTDTVTAVRQDRSRTGDKIPEAGGAFEYVFPVIRGMQAGREFFVTMCPLRLIPRLFMFDEEELVPELRAQRTLNKARVPEIARYIIDNPNDYVFSALTASIDAQVRFRAFGSDGTQERMGTLTIPMSARFVINDGQHRRAAIEQALRENSEIGDESIAVVLFLDVGLDRCQQMFADLNRYAIRPGKSLGVLYDHREAMASLIRLVVFRSPFFRDLVEMENSNLAARSRKLFTLSALYTATKALLDGLDEDSVERRVDLAASYWETVALQFPEWTQVRERQVTAGEIRRDFIHSHGIALHALGRVGNTIIRQHPNPTTWKRQLAKLSNLDWSRGNAKQWEGRALVGGRVSKSSSNVVLTTNVLRQVLGQPLSPEEQRAEDAFSRGDI